MVRLGLRILERMSHNNKLSDVLRTQAAFACRYSVMQCIPSAATIAIGLPEHAFYCEGPI